MKFVKKLLEKIKSWLRSIFNKSTKCETPRNDNPSSNEPEEIAPDMNEDSNPQTKEETLEPEVNKEETVVPEVKNEETPEPETTTEYVDEDGFLHIGTTEADFVKHYAHDLFLGGPCRMLNNHGKFSDFTPDPNGKYRMFYITNDELIRSGACTRNDDGSLRPKRTIFVDKGWEDGISNSKVEYVKNMSWDELVSFMRENDIRYEYVIFDENGKMYDVDPKLIFDEAPEQPEVKKAETPEPETTTEYVDEDGFLHIGTTEADFIKHYAHDLFLGRQCRMLNDNHGKFSDFTPDPNGKYRMFYITNDELIRSGACTRNSDGSLRPKRNGLLDKGWEDGISNSKVEYVKNMSWDELVSFMRENDIRYEYVIFDEHAMLYDVDPKLIFDEAPESVVLKEESEIKKEESDTTTEYVDEDGFLHIGTTEADFVKHYAHDLFLGRQCRMINDNHGKFSDFTPDPNGKYRMFYITNDELIRNGAYSIDSDGVLHTKQSGFRDLGWANGICDSKVEYVKNMSWDELVSFMRENDIRYEYVIFDEHAMLYDVDPKLIFDEAPESVVTKEESDTTTEFVDEEGFLHIGDNEADFVKRHSRKLFLCKDRIKATTTPNPDATYRIFSIANNELLNNGAYMMDSKGMLHSKKHNGNDKGWANGIINSKVDYANNMSWSELVTFMRVNKIKYEYLIFDENGILYDIDPKLIFNYD